VRQHLRKRRLLLKTVMIILYVVAGRVRLRTNQQRFIDSASKWPFDGRISVIDHFEKFLKLSNTEQLSIPAGHTREVTVHRSF
jgi:hypothetical protein